MKIYEVNLTIAKPSPSWITGVGTVFMSFSCHPIFFYLRAELAHKSTKRVKKVLMNAIGLELALYLIASVAGYLSLGQNLVPEIFSLRKNLRNLFSHLVNKLAGNSDILMKVLQVIFIPVTLLHVPIPIFAAREQLYTTFRIARTTKNHIMASIFLTYIAFIPPFLKPDVIAVLGFYGGVFSTAVCFIVPILLGVRIYRDRIWLCFFLKVLFTLMIFLVIATVYVSIFPKLLPNSKYS